MKLFVCLLALSLVSATICAPVEEKSKVSKRNAGYGSTYSSVPVVETPAPVRNQVVQLESVSTYGTPARSLVRDNAVVTATIQQLEPEYQRLCLDKKGLASVFYLPHPVRQSWYIQCDEFGQGFLKECPAGTIFTLNLVCENVNDLHPVEEKKAIVRDTVVGGYNTAPVFAADTTNSIETTRVEIVQEAPEFRELCLSKRSRGAYGSATAVFYLQHPTKQSFYIQCDEQGRAFLKECPAGTIFTLNLVCERIGELHAIEQTQTVVQPQLDTVVSSGYQSAPVTTTYTAAPVAPVATVSTTYSAAPVALEAPAATYTTTTLVQESPEFRDLCLSKRTSGVAVFYLPHPNKQAWYIQCDEFGRSFVKECPAGTIFTLNLACENVNDLHAIEQTQTVVQPSLDTVVGTYNTAPVFANDNAVIENAITIQEAPEFRELCLSKRSSGVVVYYLPHPTKQSWFIQCDDFGKAFIKECPANTIFTLNLVCENPNDLHPIEDHSTIVRDTVVGGYNTAPVFRVESPAVVETARVEVVQEAPEFRSLCQSNKQFGITVFYLQHPTKQSWYIQCDEFGRAFLKECPAGTIFTSRLTCEKIGEIQTVIERPVVREQIISQPVLSYGERHVERPIMREVSVQSTYGQAAPIVREQVIRPVEIPKPILREVQVPTSGYGQAAPAPVAPVISRIERPILREIQVPTSNYGQAAPVRQLVTRIERPILREVPTSTYQQAAPVIRRIERPILREISVPTSNYGQAAPIVREQVIRPVEIPRPIFREVPVPSSGYGQAAPVLTSRSSY